MARITVTISDALDEYLESESGDGSEFDSKSAVMRHLAEQGRAAADRADVVDDLEEQLAAVRKERDQLREEVDRVDDLEAELAQAEARIDELTEQLRVANSKDERMDELATYVDEERSYRKAGLLTRAKWWVTGMPDEVSS
jgi:septal ring factor EnvC (AmiA/AmiB activator)